MRGGGDGPDGGAAAAMDALHRTNDALRRGEECVAQMQYEAAIVVYSEAIETDPSMPRLYSARAAVQMKLNKIEEALKDAMKAKTLVTQVSCIYTCVCVCVCARARAQLARRERQNTSYVSGTRISVTQILKATLQMPKHQGGGGEHRARTAAARHAG